MSMTIQEACGRPLAAWTQHDQLIAQTQAQHAELIAAPDATMDALVIQRQQLRQEFAKQQIERDLRIMTGARSHISRPKTMQNVSLSMEIFGLGWSSALKHCNDMGLNPYSVSMKQVKNETN